MEISTTNIKKTIVHVLHRFHIMIFAIVVLGGMIAATLVLNSIIAKSTQTGDYTPSAANVNFDQDTIDRINQLKTRSESANAGLNLPAGRTNPFVE